MEHNLLTSDIDVEELKDKIHHEYFQKDIEKKMYEKQIIEVGLTEGFEILSYLSENHLLTKEYLIKKDVLKKCLRYRNLSILAHGTSTISKQNYELMKGLTKELIKSIVPDFDSRIKEMEHLFDVKVLA